MATKSKHILITVKATVPVDADNDLIGQSLTGLLEECDIDSLDSFADLGLDGVTVGVQDN